MTTPREASRATSRVMSVSSVEAGKRGGEEREGSEGGGGESIM